MRIYKYIILLLIILSLPMVCFLNCGNTTSNEPVVPATSPPDTTPTQSPAQPSEATPQPSTTPPTTKSGELTVISKIIGEVRLLKTGDSEWVITSIGTMLEPGDRVKTLIGSSALITFFDGSTIYMNESTEIVINEVSKAEDTGSIKINVFKEIGNTRSRVNKLIDPASRYEVETPAGSAVARGSLADITVFWDGTTHILNVEGNWYAYVDGKWIQIPPGHQLNLKPGGSYGVPFIPPELLDSSSGEGAGGGGDRQDGGEKY